MADGPSHAPVTASQATTSQASSPSSRPLPAIDQARQTLAQQINRDAIRRAVSALYRTATRSTAPQADPYLLLLQQGDRALAKGDYYSAQAAFRQACRQQPESLEAYEGLAMTLSASDQFAEAAATYEKIVELAARKERAASMPAWALRDLDQVRTVARHNQALALCRTGELAKAQDIYRNLLADDPSNTRFRFNLAAILQARGQASEAINAWRDVVAAADSLPAADAAFAWSALGQLRMDLGDAASAMDAYVHATKLTPDDASAWFNFSVAARACGSLGRAVAAAKRAVALSGRNALLHEHLGDMYLDLYRQSNDAAHLGSAVAAWQESLSLNPRQPELAGRVEQYQKVLRVLPAASRPAGGTSPTTGTLPTVN